MAVTFEELESLMIDLKNKYAKDNDKSDLFYEIIEVNENDDEHDDKIGVRFDFEAKKNRYHVDARIKEYGKIFQAYMYLTDADGGHFKVKDHKYRLLILQHTLKMNYDTKFGTWEIDPKDGEVRVAVEIPFEDMKMSFRQFKRIVHYFETKGVGGFEELLQIMQTGKAPKDDAHYMFSYFMKLMKQDELDDNGVKDDEIDSILGNLEQFGESLQAKCEKSGKSEK